MRLKNVLIVYRKELTDMLRDRRTIIGMFVFPVVIFPLMTVGFGNLEKKIRRQAQEQASRIMLLGEEHAPQLAAEIRAAQGIEVVPSARDYAQQIGDKKLRAALEIPPGFEQALKEEGKVPALHIHHYATEMRSEAASRRLEEIVRAYRDKVVEQRLASRQLSTAILKPVEAKRENVATAEKVSGIKLGMILPYLIIVLCLTGAMHPAMDLTAGEKERGTLETILASAVSRRELVVGKFLLVLTVSLVTAALALASFGVTTANSADYKEQLTRGQGFHVSPKAVGAVLLLVIPMAIFFAGTLLAISLFAKSYKEAQSYLSPLMFLALLPAMVGMLPGIELGPRLAFVPVLNISLVAKEILTGNYPWGLITLVFAVSCAYAGMALSAAVHLFQREDVLFRT